MKQSARVPALVALGGGAIALVSIPLLAAAGRPFLSLESLSPWLVTYAIGLFAALFAAPFALHQRIGGMLEADARWERAILWWAAVTAGVLAIGVLAGLGSGFDSDTLAGALALVTVTEAVLVLATVVVWMIDG